ncbi:hypothetical protein C8R45DRAFT_1105164 [Mycena sanguinolenta]|nr:hypothetical protein C8R45DRAFT_1105164 [Mycena sanguinolenta]
MPFLVSPVLTETQASVLGGLDLGTCFTLFLQGVLCSQFSRYMDSVKRDSVQIKLFVAGLALLTTLKTSECLAMMWTQNVTLFENAKVASTLWQTTAWYSKLAVLLKAAVPFYVQMFFCYRLWAGAISRNVYVVMICIMVFSFALVCGVLATVYLSTIAKSRLNSFYWVELHMGVVVFGDLILTGSIIFWLLRHNKTQFRQSAAPLTLCSLINFGVSMSRPSVHGGQAFLMLNFITTGILPQLYAWSAMWTLNSRDEIAAGGNTSYTIDLGIASCESDAKNGQLPHASNGAVTSESAATHQAGSQTFGEA